MVVVHLYVYCVVVDVVGTDRFRVPVMKVYANTVVCDGVIFYEDWAFVVVGDCKVDSVEGSRAYRVSFDYDSTSRHAFQKNDSRRRFRRVS